MLLSCVMGEVEDLLPEADRASQRVGPGNRSFQCVSVLLLRPCDLSRSARRFYPSWAAVSHACSPQLRWVAWFGVPREASSVVLVAGVDSVASASHRGSILLSSVAVL